MKYTFKKVEKGIYCCNEIPELTLESWGWAGPYWDFFFGDNRASLATFDTKREAIEYINKKGFNELKGDYK